MADVVLPDQGEDISEATITKWFKRSGDSVAEGEVLFEVSTNKADSEISSTVSGVLARILVDEGSTVQIGTQVATIDEGTAVAEVAEPVAQPVAEAARPHGLVDEVVSDGAARAEVPDDGELNLALLSPVVKRLLADHNLDPATIKGTGIGGRITRSDIEETMADGTESETVNQTGATGGATQGASRLAESTDDKVLSPVVRRLVADHNVNPGSIVGSGLGGRITRADVESAIRNQPPSSEPQADVAPTAERANATDPPSQAPVGAAAITPPVESKPDEVLRESTQPSSLTPAHAFTSVEVDFEGIERTLHGNAERWVAAEGSPLAHAPFVVRALVDALEGYPKLNAQAGADSGGRQSIHLAVDRGDRDAEAGVIRAAETKRLRAISRELAEIQAQVASTDAAFAETKTFKITGAAANPDMPAATMHVPVAEPGLVATLSLGSVSRKPVAVSDADGNEAIAVHATAFVSLLWDTDVVGSAYVAAFLGRLREIIETREWGAEI